MPRRLKTSLSRATRVSSLTVPLFLSSPLLTALAVPHGFSLRTGGVSSPPFDSLNLGGSVGDEPASVHENLRRFLSSTGVPESSFASVSQVHGASVLHARRHGAGVMVTSGAEDTSPAFSPEADALVAQPDTAVGVRTADCVPILLHDPVSGLSAAVHAGWKGTVALIAQRTVEVLSRDYDVDPGTLRASIGPSIGACCFEVGEEVARVFAAQPELVGCVDRNKGRRPHVDLQAANRVLLEAAGLVAAHIEVLARCTFCDDTSFFSHRRDAGRTGRHLAVISGGRFAPR